jgi:hypothetical protein
MTDREKLIVKTLLTMLSRMKQCEETILYHSVALLITPQLSMTEFTQALRFCDMEQWLTSVPTPFGSKKWSLNDAGKAAFAEIA